MMQGDEVFSNYGYKSNEELLLGYGFILEPNIADFFSVSLGLDARSAAGDALVPIFEPCTTQAASIFICCRH